MLKYYLLVLIILSMTYFLMSITVPDSKLAICVTYKVNDVSALWHWLTLANDLLDGDLCNISAIPIFPFFPGFQSRFSHISHIAASNTN